MSRYTDTTLYEKIIDWWYTVDHCQSANILAYDLVRIVDDWLPKEQTYCGSQLPVNCELEIDGFNDALRVIRCRLKPPKYECYPEKLPKAG